MIYTVTLNPALDYVIKVEDFRIGAVNRTVKEAIYYGGKGLNVSRMLKTLGHESTAIGFAAGFTGVRLESGLEQLGIRSELIHVEKGMTRINVKLKSNQETEINGMGPEITGDHVKQLLEKLDSLTDGDVLVLSGSIPGSMDADIYERIMERMEGKHVRIVVDAEKKLLLGVLRYHPFLIKPNREELEELFGVKLQTEEEILGYAGELRKMGARNVLVSMAGDGSILLDETGRVYRQEAAKGIVRNSVGAGDSMVAGFLAGFLETGDYAYALKLGSAAGGATAFSDDLAEPDLIRKLFAGS